MTNGAKLNYIHIVILYICIKRFCCVSIFLIISYGVIKPVVYCCIHVTGWLLYKTEKNHNEMWWLIQIWMGSRELTMWDSAIKDIEEMAICRRVWCCVFTSFNTRVVLSVWSSRVSWYCWQYYNSSRSPDVGRCHISMVVGEYPDLY